MGVESAIATLPTIPSGCYLHYKGGYYWVSGVISIDEESGKHRVQYWSLVKRVWWGREHAIFIEEGRDFHPERRTGSRFLRIGGRLLWWWLRVRYALGFLSVPG